MDDKKANDEKIDGSIGNAGTGAGTTPPPAPGTVVTSSDGAIGGPPPQVITSNGGGKRGLKVLLTIILAAAIAVGGWFAYQHFIKKKTAPAKTTQSQDIPNFSVGLLKEDFGNLYPDMNLSETNYVINGQIFEGLVRYENKSKIVPDLASTWSNPDDSTWVFTIKKGIKFHDGNTLNAQDVKYSLDTIKASTTGDNNLDLSQTFASTIKSVDVISNDQVKITTTVPDPVLLNKLTFLYIIDADMPKGDDPSQAGTGPYVIKPGTKPSANSVQMVAYDGYHGGHVYTRALTFTSKEDADSLWSGLKSHKYNLVGSSLPVSNKQDTQNAIKYTVDESAVAYLGFNTVKPGPLQNQKVREAIRYAIDPTAIAKADGVEVSPLSQLVPPTLPGYNPALPLHKPDIPKAKQLLAQAGYPNGVTIKYSSSDSPQKTDEIIKELKAAGITATLDFYDDFDKFITKYTNGQTEMYDIIYSSDTVDGLDMYTSSLPDTNYSNPKLTGLLNQASMTVNQAKRLKLLQDAAVIIDNDVPVIPLYSQKDVYWMDKNYAIRQDLPSSLVSVYFYKVHQ